MTKLSKLTKGDKLHVQHGNKEIVLTITHIALEKGLPSVNFTCSGDEELQVLTEFKRRRDKNHRSDRLNGSNKGRGWSKGSQVVKK